MVGPTGRARRGWGRFGTGRGSWGHARFEVRHNRDTCIAEPRRGSGGAVGVAWLWGDGVADVDGRIASETSGGVEGGALVVTDGGVGFGGGGEVDVPAREACEVLPGAGSDVGEGDAG